MARVGFIGTGEIASAMVRGLAGAGHEIWVSERSAAGSAALAAEFDEVTVADNQTVLDRCDIVWLCLMAQVAAKVLSGLEFRNDHQVISAMMDVRLADLKAMCGPTNTISITIPLPFVAKGGCPLPVYPPSDGLKEIFGKNNVVIELESEAALAPHFAATALCSVVFDQLRAGAGWLARFTGDPAGAETYVAALFKGYFAGAPEQAEGWFADVLKGLSTPGGLNATLRQHMEDQGTLSDLCAGLDGFCDRLDLEQK